MHELVEELGVHFRGIWRHRWLGMIAAWVFALGGWAFVYSMPDRYEVETRVFLDNRSVLKPLLQGITVEPDLDDVAAMVSQTLLIRPNLEEVLRLVESQAGIVLPSDREGLIARLASRISIHGIGRDNVYVLSYADGNPAMAKAVVDALLQVFIQRSLSDNRRDSTSASEFIERQLQHYRDKLVAAENAMIAFKRKNLSVLPGAGARYFDRIVEMKEEVRRAELDLREAEDTASTIRENLAIASREAAVPDDENADGDDEPEKETETDIRIRTLQARLDDLRLRYTERHPDIVAGVGMMEELVKRKADEDAESKRVKEARDAASRLRGGDPGRRAQPANPVVQELTVSLTAAEANVSAMRTRYVEYSKRYDELRAAANAVPQVEAEFTQLTRDYEVTKVRYEELLQRRETAIISQNMDSGGDAPIGFRVIVPPRLPSKPTEPDRPVLMTMILFAALCTWIGVAWVVSQLKPVIDSEKKLKVVGDGIPILGTVVMTWTDERRRRRNWGWFSFVVSAAGLLSVYVGIMVTLLGIMGRA